MTDRSDKSRDRLRRLRDHLPDDTLKRLERSFDKRAERIGTGRLGRAFELSKLAAGGGTKMLAARAKTALGGRADGASIELAANLVESMSEMRGLAMKVGQMLSYLEGAMPPEAQKVLSVLQSDAPPMEWTVVRKRLIEELGREPEEEFSEFDPEPIAAASIGQVHRARLHDGTEVAVKVQYPGVDQAISSDLHNARFFGQLKGLLFSNLDTKALMDELQERFLEECNYEVEADHQETFRARFRNHPTVVVPAVHREHSSRHVLTTTFYEGLGFYDWLATDPDEAARRRASATLYRFYLGSFYMNGLFNGDPHPGNYRFLEDGRIVFLDYGCVRRFDEARRTAWVEMCRAVVADDTDEIHQRALDVGFVKPGVTYDREALRQLLRYLYQAHLEEGEFDFRRMSTQNTFREMFTKNPNLFKMNMPSDAVFLNRITFGLVSLLSEIGATLDCHRAVRAYFEGRDPDWPEDPGRFSELPSHRA